MKLIAHCESFLKETVNLNKTRIDKLNRHVTAIGNYLAEVDGPIGENFVDILAQGSYAQKTIIKPVKSDGEFDADVLLEMEEVADWEPEQYVKELHAAFKKSSTYSEMATLGNRCVAIKYEGAFHVDVVPFFRSGGRGYITVRKDNICEVSDPVRFNEWLREQNKVTDGYLVKSIRLMKYLKQFKTIHIKSVILSILMAKTVEDGASRWATDRYKDLPTAFVNMIEDLSSYLEAHPTLPAIYDPSGTGVDFSARWDQKGYSAFSERIKNYAVQAREAYNEDDKDKSMNEWRRLFGGKFGAAPSERQVAASSQYSSFGPELRFTEEFVEDYWGVQLDSRYKLSLEGVVEDAFKRRVTYRLRSHYNKVSPNKQIKFTASLSGPNSRSCVLWWKVLNVGDEAARQNCLRGQIKRSEMGNIKVEPTSFEGDHYVEVYAVLNGTVVAREKHPVNIEV